MCAISRDRSGCSRSCTPKRSHSGKPLATHEKVNRIARDRRLIRDLLSGEVNEVHQWSYLRPVLQAFPTVIFILGAGNEICCYECVQNRIQCQIFEAEYWVTSPIVANSLAHKYIYTSFKVFESRLAGIGSMSAFD